MTLDPQMKIFIDQLVAAGMPPDFAAIGPEAAKASAAAAGALMGAGPTLAREENLSVDGGDGPIPARLNFCHGLWQNLRQPRRGHG